jgi:hypothetical protein
VGPLRTTLNVLRETSLGLLLNSALGTHLLLHLLQLHLLKSTQCSRRPLGLLPLGKRTLVLPALSPQIVHPVREPVMGKLGYSCVYFPILLHGLQHFGEVIGGLELYHVWEQFALI